MADTIRKKIVDTIKAKCATILVTNGYNTNIGINPYKAIKNFDPGGIPRVVVIPSDEDAEKSNYNADDCTTIIRIEGVVPITTENQFDISELIRDDIYKAMISSGSSFLEAAGAGLSNNIYYTSGGFGSIAEGNENIAGGFCVFSINYPIKPGDATTLGG